MRVPKIYLETTMFNYYFDVERDAHADTVKLFEEIKQGKYEAYTSVYVTDELEVAPEPKRSKMFGLITEYGVTVLNANEETAALADIYVAQGIIPTAYRTDGRHIACTAVNGLDMDTELEFQAYSEKEND